jgi:endonuclease YncB( thermonuclease family)
VALSLTAPSALAQTLAGKIVGVSDGDTITVLDAKRTQHKIRLSGIDAPERRQAFGTVSKQNLARMVFKKEVTLLC